MIPGTTCSATTSSAVTRSRSTRWPGRTTAGRWPRWRRRQSGLSGGHTFLFDFGATNFMHVSKAKPGPLPYDSKILRVAPGGDVHVFAEGLQGGWNELRFDRDRMYISCLRRSFSTGEYHEPD